MASRLLKKAHLQRWRAPATLRRTRQYASRLGSRAALPFDGLTVPSEVEGHLDLFEQPGQRRILQRLAMRRRSEGGGLGWWAVVSLGLHGALLTGVLSLTAPAPITHPASLRVRLLQEAPEPPRLAPAPKAAVPAPLPPVAGKPVLRRAPVPGPTRASAAARPPVLAAPPNDPPEAPRPETAASSNQGEMPGSAPGPPAQKHLVGAEASPARGSPGRGAGGRVESPGGSGEPAAGPVPPEVPLPARAEIGASIVRLVPPGSGGMGGVGFGAAGHGSGDGGRGGMAGALAAAGPGGRGTGSGAGGLLASGGGGEGQAAGPACPISSARSAAGSSRPRVTHRVPASGDWRGRRSCASASPRTAAWRPWRSCALPARRSWTRPPKPPSCGRLPSPWWRAGSASRWPSVSRNNRPLSEETRLRKVTLA